LRRSQTWSPQQESEKIDESDFCNESPGVMSHHVQRITRDATYHVFIPPEDRVLLFPQK